LSKDFSENQVNLSINTKKRDENSKENNACTLGLKTFQCFQKHLELSGKEIIISKLYERDKWF
jgi:hypothetical protein